MMRLVKAVAGAVALALVVSAPCPTATAGPVPPAAYYGRTAASDATLERSIYSLVNRYRSQRGLRLLVLDPEISRVARRHSAAMAAHARDVGHEGFDDRVLILRRALTTRRTAENVALNRGYRDPAAEAVRGWIASPGHRQNMDGPYYEATGIGVARNADGELYFTQIFVGF
jgi:uncharacterized protein YkwD